ncbi:beta-ketoacyl-ACP synthase II [Chloroflexi bacterium TSY]|nr:beta-ketoacyl-ACP synthase II [Chloroflexi bacterium TSY]
MANQLNGNGTYKQNGHHPNGHGTNDHHSNELYVRLNRVVITGLGSITPLGLTVTETWENLLEGKSGIALIDSFDASELRTRFGGEVKNFDPANYMDRKEARRLDPYIHFALAATQEAVADARLDFAAEEPTRAGAIVASGIGGLKTTLDSQLLANKKGVMRLSPFMIPNMLVDSAAGKIAIEYDLRGPNHSVVSACASGTSACGEAFELLRRGDADLMLVGGAESSLVPIIMAGFDIMGAASRNNDDPEGACRPFDSNRDGFVMSEGCAMLVMETEEHALQRGAKIYAEVIGYGSSADAYHMAAPHEEGRGAINAMTMALRKASAYGVQPEDVDYINAHGTATRINDVVETKAIKQVFGEHTYNLTVSSTKSMIGHLFSGAGAIETVFCAKTIESGMIPPTINLTSPDPDCDLDYNPLRAKKADVQVTLSNSFGFGGHNACIMLRNYATQ